jgi:hypothetical protein
MDPTWEHLAKNAEDAEKIEEAIARLIEEHNEDSEAHLAEGQSLNSHKDSEIIDHLAGSVIADKIKEWARIKLSGQFERDDVHWFTIFESADGFDKSTSGSGSIGFAGGDLRLQTGETDGSSATLSKSLFGSYDFSWDKQRKVSFGIEAESAPDILAYIGTGYKSEDEDYSFVGFKLVNYTLYGVVNDGSGETLVELKVYSLLPGAFRLSFTYYPGSKVEFFIDNFKEGEITTGLPSGEEDSPDFICYAQIKNTSANNKSLWLRHWDFWQE